MPEKINFGGQFILLLKNPFLCYYSALACEYPDHWAYNWRSSHIQGNNVNNSIILGYDLKRVSQRITISDEEYLKFLQIVLPLKL